MKNKKKFTNLLYTWWVYVGIAIIIPIFWVWCFNTLAQPAANEKLLITIVGNGVENEKLNEDLEKRMPTLTNQYIKQITVEEIIYQSDYNLTNMLWSRSLDADIIIITNTAMFEGIGEDYFPILDETKASELFGEVEFYREKNNSYGMLLYDGETENNFSRYYSKEKCWVFFTVDGKNTGSLNGKGRTEDDAAIQTVKWLFSS